MSFHQNWNIIWLLYNLNDVTSGFCNQMFRKRFLQKFSRGSCCVPRGDLICWGHCIILVMSSLVFKTLGVTLD